MKRERVKVTPEQAAFIRARWPSQTAESIGAELGLLPGTVKQRAWMMGVRKHPVVLSMIRRRSGASPRRAPC